MGVRGCPGLGEEKGQSQGFENKKRTLNKYVFTPSEQNIFYVNCLMA